MWEAGVRLCGSGLGIEITAGAGVWLSIVQASARLGVVRLVCGVRGRNKTGASLNGKPV